MCTVGTFKKPSKSCNEFTSARKSSDSGTFLNFPALFRAHELFQRIRRLDNHFFSDDFFMSVTPPSELTAPGDPAAALGAPTPVIDPSVLPASLFPGNQFVQKKRARRPKNAPPKQKEPPVLLNGDGPDSNEAFARALEDPSLSFDPQALHFYPASYWTPAQNTFGELVTKFFRRKNNSNCRFPHKLYNALLIVDAMPEMFHLVGVRWVGEGIFEVDKYIFGRLLGIQTFDGGLFHGQGNFPSHGFQEIGVGQVSELLPGLDLTGIDFDRVRLMRHSNGLFVKGADEMFVTQLKWTNP